MPRAPFAAVVVAFIASAAAFGTSLADGNAGRISCIAASTVSLLATLGAAAAFIWADRLYKIAPRRISAPSVEDTTAAVTAPGPPDPLDNKPWLGLVEECTELFGELDRHRADFDPLRQEVVDHVSYRLQEVLERNGVEGICGDARFDHNRHQPDRSGAATGAAIAETLSPGFAVGRRVLRRARVRLG